MVYKYKIDFRCHSRDEVESALNAIERYGLLNTTLISYRGEVFTVHMTDEATPDKLIARFSNKVEVLVPQIRGFTLTVLDD